MLNVFSEAPFFLDHVELDWAEGDENRTLEQLG